MPLPNAMLKRARSVEAYRHNEQEEAGQGCLRLSSRPETEHARVNSYTTENVNDYGFKTTCRSRETYLWA